MKLQPFERKLAFIGALYYQLQNIVEQSKWVALFAKKGWAKITLYIVCARFATASHTIFDPLFAFGGNSGKMQSVFCDTCTGVHVTLNHKRWLISFQLT